MRVEPWPSGLAVCFLAGALSVAASGQALGQEVDLRPKFVPGQVERYTLEQNSSAKTTSNRDKTKNTTSQTDQTIWVALRTMRVDEAGVATVEVSCERIKLAIHSDDFKGSYDSDQATNAPAPSPGTPARPATPTKHGPDERDNAEMLAAIVRPMLGSRLTLKIDAAGNILSATGGAELSPSSLIGVEGLKSLPSRSGAGLLGPIFTAKKSSGRARIGESWTSDDTIDASALGPMKMRTTHTLRSVSGGVANVDVSGRIDKASEGSSGPVQIKDSSFAGRYRWDTARGVLESLDINQSVGMEVSIEGMVLSSSHKARTRLTRLPGDGREETPATPPEHITPGPAPTKPRQ